MLVVACVKQVPDTTQVKVDPVTNTLVREGIPLISLRGAAKIDSFVPPLPNEP